MLLPSLNSCVNPWIYIYFNPNLVTLFCQFFKRRPSPNSGNSYRKNYPGGRKFCSHRGLHKKLTNDSADYTNSMDSRSIRDVSRLDLTAEKQPDSKQVSRPQHRLGNTLQPHIQHTGSTMTTESSRTQFESTVTLDHGQPKTPNRGQFSLQFDRMWNRLSATNKQPTSSQIRLYNSKMAANGVVKNSEQFVV